MREISVNAANIDGQPMFKLIDEARKLERKGIEITHLEIGDPDFPTPQNVTEAAVASLRNGETHYVSSWGMPDFVDAIRAATLSSRGFEPDQSQVLVTPGANISIFYAIFCLVNPGQEVLVPDPGFPTYLSAVHANGAVARPYPLRSDNEFRIRAADIEPLISEKTRLLIINSPQNPTGALTEEAELHKVFELAERHDLFIYSDEIYARMVYQEYDFFSIASIDGAKTRVILSNGFSKAFAMTGWRLGTVVAPENVAERMMLLLQTTSSCVSPFIQRAGIEALQGDQSAIDAMMNSYRKRRDFLVDALNQISGITCHSPGGAFYAFPDISSFGLTSEQFAAHMLHHAGVAVLPGSSFGRQGEGFIRVSYATSEENLAVAVRKIAQSCEALRESAK